MVYPMFKKLRIPKPILLMVMVMVMVYYCDKSDIDYHSQYLIVYTSVYVSCAFDVEHSCLAFSGGKEW